MTVNQEGKAQIITILNAIIRDGMIEDDLKNSVHDFWQAQACGERYAHGETLKEQLEEHARARHRLEPYIHTFAKFEQGAGKNVLEIGVGMGADHLEWAKSRPARLTGIDLTEKAIEFTTARLALYGLQSDLRTADAEDPPFPDNTFDIIYSWGVLHHSPDTPKAIQHVLRMLKPRGVARIMIYHHPSLVGWMLWARYALFRGRPFMSMKEIYSQYLESPGTKAYSVVEALQMMQGFEDVQIETVLSIGDLLEGEAGQRHGGLLMSTVKKIWPRWLIKRYMCGYGLTMIIQAVKPVK